MPQSPYRAASSTEILFPGPAYSDPYLNITSPEKTSSPLHVKGPCPLVCLPVYFFSYIALIIEIIFVYSLNSY